MHYRVHPKLQIGLEINPAAEEIGPLVNWFLLTETERRPALFFGTSSDRIGSPEGEQSYFLTAAKHHPTWPVSGYVSLNYSEWDDGFNVPFGVEVELSESFSARHMFDGDRSHLMLNYHHERFGVSLLWVWYEKFGIALSTGF